MTDTVTITLKEYESLKKDSNILDKLYSAGVDSWEWYDEALNERVRKRLLKED